MQATVRFRSGLRIVAGSGPSGRAPVLWSIWVADPAAASPRNPGQRVAIPSVLRRMLSRSAAIPYTVQILGQATQPTTQRPDSPMNAPSELNFEDMLRIRLEVLKRGHRDLDEAVHALEATGRPDQLTLRRLKKQKLALKDQIVKIEDQLIPDIIA